MTRTAFAIPAAFAAGAILFSLGATVAGQSSVVSPEKIRACVTSTGTPRFLAAGITTCRTGERLVEWSAQGVPGAVGPTGPSGPAGEKGAKGDKGDKGDPAPESLRSPWDFFDIFPEIGRITLDPPPAAGTTTNAARVIGDVAGRKVYGLTTGQGLSDADMDNDGLPDRVGAGDVDADAFGPIGVDLAVDGTQPSLAEAAARRRAFHDVTIFVATDMDGDGIVHAADEAGIPDEGLVIRLEEAHIVRHGFSAGTDFMGGRRHDAAMSSIGNIRGRTATVDARPPHPILEHIELDYDRITWLSMNAGVTTTLGRWDVREGHS